MRGEVLQRYAGMPVIAGAGLAGLSAALHFDGPCILLSASPLGDDAASALAQGGIAAALSADDSPALHAMDTIAAGAGLCDEAVVRAVTRDAPGAVAQLQAWGVAFDCRADGALDLHLEAAHSRPRIAHADGDRSGAEIMRALVAQVRATPRITVLEGMTLCALDAPEGRVRGVWVRDAAGVAYLPSTVCVIATGGVGALYAEATSPLGNRGLGLAVAARAGVKLGDMEFVQFHPTALDIGEAGRRPLISEAVRGAGAILIDETGARFTEELAPRDVVSRAVAAHLKRGHRVLLDARPALGARFAEHFPGIARACLAHGIDPAREAIPVRPAVHYHMGGIAVDHRGRSSIHGLWSCGEAACTGLHGANRLASNSLLEAFVGGRDVARDIAGRSAAPVSCGGGHASSVAPPHYTTREIGAWMSTDAGILRDEAGLSRILSRLVPLARKDDHALVGALIARAALLRRESRGSHCRTDFPESAAPVRREIDLSFLSLGAERSMECV